MTDKKNFHLDPKTLAKAALLGGAMLASGNVLADSNTNNVAMNQQSSHEIPAEPKNRPTVEQIIENAFGDAKLSVSPNDTPKQAATNPTFGANDIVSQMDYKLMHPTLNVELPLSGNTMVTFGGGNVSPISSPTVQLGVYAGVQLSF